MSPGVAVSVNCLSSHAHAAILDFFCPHFIHYQVLPTLPPKCLPSPSPSFPLPTNPKFKIPVFPSRLLRKPSSWTAHIPSRTSLSIFQGGCFQTRNLTMSPPPIPSPSDPVLLGRRSTLSPAPTGLCDPCLPLHWLLDTPLPPLPRPLTLLGLCALPTFPSAASLRAQLTWSPWHAGLPWLLLLSGPPHGLLRLRSCHLCDHPLSSPANRLPEECLRSLQPPAAPASRSTMFINEFFTGNLKAIKRGPQPWE